MACRASEIHDSVVGVAVDILGRAVGIEADDVFGAAGYGLIEVDGGASRPKVVWGRGESCGNAQDHLKGDVIGQTLNRNDLTSCSLRHGDGVRDGCVAESDDVGTAFRDGCVPRSTQRHQRRVIGAGHPRVLQGRLQTDEENAARDHDRGDDDHGLNEREPRCLVAAPVNLTGKCCDPVNAVHSRGKTSLSSQLSS